MTFTIGERVLTLEVCAITLLHYIDRGDLACVHAIVKRKGTITLEIGFCMREHGSWGMHYRSIPLLLMYDSYVSV